MARMPQLSLRVWCALAASALAIAFASPLAASPDGDTDLDRFMAAVLAQRDENWKKLQQYVLDERETAEFLGPGKARLFGLDREYSWFIKEGVFVRSPVRVDGVTLSDKDRRAAEVEWIESHRGRDAPTAALSLATHSQSSEPGGADLEQVMKLTREPQFVSAAYFLRFKFEPGRYAFVGREEYDGRPVLRVEYYPTQLYSGDRDGEDEHGTTKEANGEDAKIERQMNKVALITLWIEPDAPSNRPVPLRERRSHLPAGPIDRSAGAIRRDHANGSTLSWRLAAEGHYRRRLVHAGERLVRRDLCGLVS